jgi:hypothetical protein
MNLDVSPKPKGLRALLGAAVAIIGVLATSHPHSVLLKALSESLPELATALPTVITACGAIVAALSEPPELSRKRTMR